MASELLELLLLGHIFGDYFFQTHNMATKKTNDSSWCMLHCLVYGVCVCLCLLVVLDVRTVVLMFPIVLLSHYPIDRYSLAAKFISWKGGPESGNMFFPSIYIVIDNTTHILIMYFMLLVLTGYLGCE